MGSCVGNSETGKWLHFAWRVVRGWQLVCVSMDSSQNETDLCRNGEPDTNLTVNILKNCAKVAPELLDEKQYFNVTSEQVGLRPSRTGGARIEAEKVKFGHLEVDVVHSYGHSGGG